MAACGGGAVLFFGPDGTFESRVYTLWRVFRSPFTEDVPPSANEILAPVLVDDLHKVSHVFQVMNPANQVVNILGVKTSCGCSSAKLGANVLQPRQKTTLSLDATVQPNIAGKTQLSVILQTDLPDSPNWFYKLTVPCHSVLTFESSDLQLHDLPPNVPFERTFRCYLHRHSGQGAGPPPELLCSSSSGSLLVCMLEPAKLVVLSDGVQRWVYSLRISGRTGSGLGTQHDTIRAIVKDVADTLYRATANVRWHVAPTVYARPSRVYFGDLSNKNEPVVRQVDIVSRDGLPLNILGIKSTELAVVGEFFRAKSSDSDSPPLWYTHNHEKRVIVHGQLKLVLSLPLVDQLLSGTATVLTDHPHSPNVEVRFSAIRTLHFDSP